jgi:hypothetical protein
VTTPRRYRLALLAYPAAYRAERGPEILATLADGDDERGHPSLREAGALVGRGITMRARKLERPDWLLAAAAALVLAALLGAFTWAERPFLFRGDVGGYMWDPPGVWVTLALGVTAYVAIAALFFGAAETRRSRRITALLAAPFALLLFATPGRLFWPGFPGPEAVLDHVRWMASAVYHNDTITIPTALAAVAATWISLRLIGSLAAETGRRVLSIALALAAAVAIGQAWVRPDLGSDIPRPAMEGYAQSAFADLGIAALLASLAVVLALAALWPARPKPRL